VGVEDSFVEVIFLTMELGLQEVVIKYRLVFHQTWCTLSVCVCKGVTHRISRDDH